MIQWRGYLNLDISDKNNILLFAEALTNSYGKVDVLINNAGTSLLSLTL